MLFLLNFMIYSNISAAFVNLSAVPYNILA